jgi:ABC-type branched-subunit amino acid transport system substrate-binding protein
MLFRCFSRLRVVVCGSSLALCLIAIAACDHAQPPPVAQPVRPPQVQRPAGPSAEADVLQRTLPAPAPVPATEGERRPADRGELPPVPPDGARVALLLPLSGRLAEIGKGMLNASQMALFDIADDRLQLVAFDTGDSADAAQAAARRAVANNASLIIGPLLAASTRAVGVVAKPANVRVLSFSSDRKVGGEGVYVIGFTPETEVERVIGFAAENGARRFVLLAPKDNYGETVAAALRKTAKDHQLTVGRIELYDPKTRDFRGIIDRVRGVTATGQPAQPPPAGLPPPGSAAPAGVAPPLAQAAPAEPPLLPFDALLVADGGDRLRLLAAQLSEKGLAPTRVRVLGTGTWDETALKQEANLAGAWFAAPEPGFREDFEVRYRKLYGAAPPRLATLGYDATALAAVLARDRGRDGHTDAWLTSPDGFFGRDGLFRLLPEGYADRRLAVLQIGNGTASIVSEAPRRFSGF